MNLGQSSSPRVQHGRIVSIRRTEVLRYLGYRGEADPAFTEELQEMYLACEQELLPLLRPAAVLSVQRVTHGANTVDLGFGAIQSRSLCRHLQACRRAVLFAATVGAGVDRLLAKYSRLSPARAVILQAMGAAAVEQWCDELEQRVKEDFQTAVPRFSCGYGDFSLAAQRDIFALLSVTHHIGVTLTEGNLMLPTKSVTAVIGIEKEETI